MILVFLRFQTRVVVTGSEVFGTYFDEGRITRCTAMKPVWSLLARRSIERYKELEKLSGNHSI